MTLGTLGKKHVELLFKWIPSLAIYGGAASALGVYVTEWRLIADHIPFYGSKFDGLPPPE